VLNALTGLLRRDDLVILGLDAGLDVRAGLETLAREDDLIDAEGLLLLRLRLTLDDPRLAELLRTAELLRLAELPRLDLPPPPRPLFAKTGSAISIRTKTTAI